MTKENVFIDNFEDATDNYHLHPDTFNIPTDEELEQIQENYSLKVCAHDERFWVSVVDVYDDIIIARVDNKLVSDQFNYGFGDLVMLKKSNIYSIQSVEVQQQLIEYMTNRFSEEEIIKLTDGVISVNKEENCACF